MISASSGTLTAAAFAGATITNNGTFTVTISGTADAINGAIANLAHNGIADRNGTFTVSIRTTEGAITAIDSVVINVTPVTDIVADTATTLRDTAISIDVLANDAFEGPRTLTAVNGNAIAPNAIVAVSNGTVQFYNGLLLVTPTPAFVGTILLTYEVTAGTSKETASVTVTVSAPAAPPAQARIAFGAGVNLDGMSVFSSNLRVKPNAPNHHFGVPRASDIAYLASKGFIKSRLPVTWELLQPVLLDANINTATRGIVGLPGDFNAVYASYITSVLDAHAANGMRCIIDLENSCRYVDFVYQPDGSVLGLAPSPDAISQAYTTTLNQTRNRIFALAAGVTLTQAHFTDFWTRAATKWKAHLGFGGYGLMGKPFNLPAVGGIISSQSDDLTIWPAYAQAAINAIRAIDATSPIYVSGNKRSDIYELGASNPGFPLVGAKLIYEGVLYLDRDNSGNFFDYNTESAQLAVGATGNVSATTGRDRLNTAIVWANSKTPVPNLALSVFGVPIDDARWLLSAKNAIDLAVTQGVEIYASTGGSYYLNRSDPLNAMPQWHQNRPKEPLLFGTMRQAAAHKGHVLFDDSQSFAAIGAPITVTVYARGNVDVALALTVAKSAGATGTLSKTALVIPAGANGFDTFTYTPTASQVATLTYSGPAQVPPPRKVYSLTDAPAHESTSLIDAAHSILAKYAASKWEMRDGFTDYVMGAPAVAGNALRAVADTGFGSTPDNALEMVNSNNESLNQGLRLRPVLRNSPSNVRSGDFSAQGTTGLWSRKNRIEQAGYVPKNKCVFEIQEAHFAMICLSVPAAAKTGSALMTSVTHTNSRVELRLDNGVARCIWEDAAGINSTLADTSALALNTPLVVTATSIAGAQKLRVASAQVASDTKTFGATAFNAHIIGGGYYGYDFKDSFGSTAFAAVVGKGAPTTLEIGVLERYLLSVAGVASAAPPPAPEAAPITPTTDAQLSTATFNYTGVAQKGAWLQTKDPYLLLTNGSVVGALPVDIQTWVDRSPNASNLVEADTAVQPHAQLNNGVRKINVYNNFVSAKGGSGEAGIDATKGFLLVMRFMPVGYAALLWSDEAAVNTGRFLRWFGGGANEAVGAGDVQFSVGNGTSRVSVRSVPGSIATTAPYEGPVQPVTVLVYHDVAAQTLNMLVAGQVTSVPFTGTFAPGAAGYALAGKPALSMEVNTDFYELMHVHNRLDATLRSQWQTYFSGQAAPAAPTPAPPPIQTAGITRPFGARTVPYLVNFQPNNFSLAQQDALCIDQYNYWKTTLVNSMGGTYPAFNGDQNKVVSEGIGYGMLICVIFAGYDANARVLFDNHYNVARLHPAYSLGTADLMEWRLDRTFANNNSDGWGYSAPDGDLDIAQALLMADRQWGSTGPINYKQKGIDVINALKLHHFKRNDGSSSSGGRDDLTRMSDYMTGHFKDFRIATGDTFWDLAVTKSFQLFDRCQTVLSPPAIGLIPDFLIYMNTANPIADIDHIGDNSPWSDTYFWNSCRVPWRMGADYLLTGDVRARNVGSKLVDFFNNKHGGNVSAITNGYRMDGSEINPGSTYNPSVFYETLLPAAAGEARFQAYYSALWSRTNAVRTTGYYGTELGLLSLITASGNWWRA